jgi:hypothetical protein
VKRPPARRTDATNPGGLKPYQLPFLQAVLAEPVQLFVAVPLPDSPRLKVSPVVEVTVTV